MSRYRRLKLELMAQDDSCHWCGEPVKDYGKLPDGTTCPDDMATIDHTISRCTRQKGEVVEKVLSCNKCNNIRGMLDNYRKQTGKSYPQVSTCNRFNNVIQY